MRRYPSNDRNGFTLYQLLSTLVVFGIVAGSIAYYMHRTSLADRATGNLRQVYSALGLYEIDRGYLPKLAFFPDDPRLDNDSLLVVLSKYGVSEELCISPVAPPAVRAIGLNYVWNTRLNGRKLHVPGQTDWVLANLECLSPDVPAPYFGKHIVLYSDGKVALQSQPPPGLERP